MRSPLMLASLLASALAAAPAAAGEQQLFTTGTHGTIVVGPDGRVVDVDLEGEDTLGEQAVAGYEQVMRGWEFEPVLEDGRPVTARGFVNLSLLAAREENSDSATLGIRDVWFVDPPEQQRRDARARLKSMPPPRYPTGALRAGVGAEVRLLVELDASGAVARAEVEKLAFVGDDPGAARNSLAREFARVSKEAAADWVLPDVDDGTRLVAVPVRFIPGEGRGWRRLHGHDWQADPWVGEMRAREAAVEQLSASGDGSRLVLRSELPPAPGAGG